MRKLMIINNFQILLCKILSSIYTMKMFCILLKAMINRMNIPSEWPPFKKLKLKNVQNTQIYCLTCLWVFSCFLQKFITRFFVFKITFKNIPRRVAFYNSFFEQRNHHTCLSFSLGIPFCRCSLFAAPVSITAEFQAHLAPFGTESFSVNHPLVFEYL